SSRLARLRRTFCLDDRDADLLDLLIAVELEPGIARVCAYLQDDATLRYPSVSLAARLFGHGRSLHRPGQSVRRWGRVTEQPQRAGEPPAVLLAPEVCLWLTGGGRDEAAGAEARPKPLDSWPVAETVRWARAALAGQRALRIVVSGVPGSGRRTFARERSIQLGRPLLVADSTGVAEADWPLVARRVARRALLEGSALAWAGPLVSAPHPTPPVGVPDEVSDGAPDIEWIILEAGERGIGRASSERAVAERHVTLR